MTSCREGRACCSEKQNAVPTGPRNGDDLTEKHSSTFRSDCYYSDASAAIHAGYCYAENRDDCPCSVWRSIAKCFDLTAKEATRTIAIANEVRR